MPAEPGRIAKDETWNNLIVCPSAGQWAAQQDQNATGITWAWAPCAGCSLQPGPGRPWEENDGTMGHFVNNLIDTGVSGDAEGSLS